MQVGECFAHRKRRLVSIEWSSEKYWQEISSARLTRCTGGEDVGEPRCVMLSELLQPARPLNGLPCDGRTSVSTFIGS